MTYKVKKFEIDKYFCKQKKSIVIYIIVFWIHFGITDETKHIIRTIVINLHKYNFYNNLKLTRIKRF